MRRTPIPVEHITISNPKLYKDLRTKQEARIFPYYAGFSNSFVHDLLASLELRPESIIFDPWNGSGTTTQSALELGHRAIGFDLNPVMVVVAKARMLSPLDHPSLSAIACSLVEQAKNDSTVKKIDAADPLMTWLSPSSASSIRALEHRINRTLISSDEYVSIRDNAAIDRLSPLAAFFYVCLFRTTRKLLENFIPSNPTWVKIPKSKSERRRPSQNLIFEAFVNETESLISSGGAIQPVPMRNEENVAIKIGNAERLDLKSSLVDAIISSPPYCTRIDYAVSTTLELAVLGYGKSEFELLRRSLTGTSTVEPKAGEVDESWGPMCLDFLDKMRAHPSIASKGYYFKNHVQYFRSMSLSIREIARVLKPNGLCFLVAQDSHYKDIHNDVSSIISEMAGAAGLRLTRRVDFSTSQSMVKVNRKSRLHLPRRHSTESVLCFQNS
ncbi:DNA methyltransferase [Paraburkholderia caledonica]|uniref:DNA methyltransferase n=1 Tax=Paraburkholderia caledonica TaxID=134536 RepID=UPI0038BC19A7